MTDFRVGDIVQVTLPGYHSLFSQWNEAIARITTLPTPRNKCYYVAREGDPTDTVQLLPRRLSLVSRDGVAPVPVDPILATIRRLHYRQHFYKTHYEELPSWSELGSPETTIINDSPTPNQYIWTTSQMLDTVTNLQPEEEHR